MRFTFTLLLALVALGSATSLASAQDAATPVVVGERRFTAAELRAGHAPTLVEDEWVAREAAARGIVVPEVALAAALAEAARQDAELAGFLDPRPPEELRVELAAGIRRELLIDALMREVAPGPRAFGRAFDALAKRGRASTRCLSAYAEQLPNMCSNQPVRRGACVSVGAHEICGESRAWEISIDPVSEFYDARKAFAEPDWEPPFRRLRAYLRAHAPVALRRCFWEAGDEGVGFSCPFRADAIAVAYATTRIHQRAKRDWTVPATAGRL